MSQAPQPQLSFSGEGYPLFEYAPHGAARLPRVRLGQWPTPVEQVQLQHQGRSLKLWIKRDDRSGALYGGNKVRKLEFLFGDALARGKDAVWTVGAIGSHHCLATSIYAKSLGLKMRALHFPQPLTEHVRRNIRAIHATGAELTLLTRASLPAAIFRQHLRSWSLQRKGAAYFPGGGSSALGAVGFVNAACELALQIQAGELDEPDEIYVAAGTLGTLVGLWAGAKLAGLRSRIVGVRVIDKLMCNKLMGMRLASALLGVLHRSGFSVDSAWLDDPFTLLDDYFGTEYGLATPACSRALEVWKSHDLPSLEPTYTGKALAAVFDRYQDDKKILFWDTFNSQPIDSWVDACPPQAVSAPYQGYFLPSEPPA